jgi:glycosyltransferase involved in cell wall biosynthesis
MLAHNVFNRPEAGSFTPPYAKEDGRIRIAILHPTDPLCYASGGIASYIRGVLALAPRHLEFTLIGASADTNVRPIGVESTISVGDGIVRFLPIVDMDSSGIRGRVPLIVRYTCALARVVLRGRLAPYDILDFHRVEPTILLRRDPRPKNLYMHQDLSGVKAKGSEILWHHVPHIYATMERWLLPVFDRLFSVRHASVNAYAKRFPRLAPRIAFLPTWVDTKFWCPPTNMAERQLLRAQIAADTGANPKGDWLIFVGRLDHAKDPLLLLAAFSTLLQRRPASHLFIIGDGLLKSEVIGACTSLNFAESVSILGSQGAVYVRRFLQAADVFVLSSSYEGMPFVVLEALATGTPVASADVGEVRLMVKDGCNGRISDDRSPSSLAAAIEYVLCNANAIRGGNCVRSVEAFSPSNILSRLYQNYGEQA